MNFSFKLTQQQKEEYNLTAKHLIKQPKVQEWLKKYDVCEDIVFDYPNKFQMWLSSIHICEHCKGLMECKQKKVGQYLEMSLDQDGIIDFSINECLYSLKLKQELQHERNYVYHHLSTEQLKIDLTNLTLENESYEYKALISEIAKLLVKDNSKKGLYLFGVPGVGKSYLAAGISNYYAKHNKSCAFLHMPTFISELKLYFNDNEAFRKFLNQIQKVDVLVLDDIGGENITLWSRDDILLPILNERMEQKKLTFFTSNYTIEDLKERYFQTNNKIYDPIGGERLIERINVLAHIEFLQGVTRRK